MRDYLLGFAMDSNTVRISIHQRIPSFKTLLRYFFAPVTRFFLYLTARRIQRYANSDTWDDSSASKSSVSTLNARKSRYSYSEELGNTPESQTRETMAETLASTIPLAYSLYSTLSPLVFSAHALRLCVFFARVDAGRATAIYATAWRTTIFSRVPLTVLRTVPRCQLVSRDNILGGPSKIRSFGRWYHKKRVWTWKKK